MRKLFVLLILASLVVSMCWGEVSSKPECPKCNKEIKAGDMLVPMAGPVKDGNLTIIHIHKGCSLDDAFVKQLKKL